MVDEQVQNTAPKFRATEVKAIAAMLAVALARAADDLAAGDPQEAERRAKAVSALAQALAHLIALAATPTRQGLSSKGHSHQTAAALRARIERRLARFLGAFPKGGVSGGTEP